MSNSTHIKAHRKYGLSKCVWYKVCDAIKEKFVLTCDWYLNILNVNNQVFLFPSSFNKFIMINNFMIYG